MKWAWQSRGSSGAFPEVVGIAIMFMAAIAHADPRLPPHDGEASHDLQILGDQSRPDTFSADATLLRGLIATSGDARGHPFAMVDKRNATVHLFDSAGTWKGSAPVLLGSKRGDHTVPGVGEKPIRDVLPHERTTPAGRFVAETGRNARNEEVIWIDYDAGVSMHPVLTVNAWERRVERLATPTPRDNRVSYGCVNVPTKFYDEVALPLLRRPGAIIYVLPEVRRIEDAFPGLVDPRREARRRVGRRELRRGTTQGAAVAGS